MPYHLYACGLVYRDGEGLKLVYGAHSVHSVLSHDIWLKPVT